MKGGLQAWLLAVAKANWRIRQFLLFTELMIRACGCKKMNRGFKEI